MSVRCFGKHVPATENRNRVQSPMAVFTRGLQVSGTHWTFRFANGYEASLIDDGYGADQGLYEIAVMRDGHIVYDTPITDDVLGFLTEEDVITALDSIKALDATS